MNNEFLKMQKLAGLITESQYKSKLPFSEWESSITDFIQTNITSDIDELDMLNDVLRNIIANNERDLEDSES